MLSSKLSVGVHILAVLAYKRGEPLTSELLGTSVNTNPVVIRRLLGLFREAGYVESKNGVGGGWLLVADPRQITLLDVLQTVST
jgi:DNA-binding IscR family transcriptional regulator